jgi:hypothetical protein
MMIRGKTYGISWKTYLKEAVVDAVGQSCVNIYKKNLVYVLVILSSIWEFNTYGRILGADLNRLDEGIYRDMSETDTLAVDLRLGADLLVAGYFAQTRSTTEEDVGVGSFGEEEEEQDEDRCRHPEDFPLGPAPAACESKYMILFSNSGATYFSATTA